MLSTNLPKNKIDLGIFIRGFVEVSLGRTGTSSWSWTSSGAQELEREIEEDVALHSLKPLLKEMGQTSGALAEVQGPNSCYVGANKYSV